MIRVRNKEASVQFYDSCFGLKEIHSADFPNFSLHYLRNEESGTELELTVNKGQEEEYKLGNGYGHMAVAVDNLEEAHKSIQQLGYQPNDIVDFKHEGKTMARFFFVSDPDGYKIEVLERSERYQ